MKVLNDTTYINIYLVNGVYSRQLSQSGHTKHFYHQVSPK